MSKEIDNLDIETKSTLIEEIKDKQFEDGNLVKVRTNIPISKSQDTSLDASGVLNYKGRVCVPRVDDLVQNC